VIEKLTNHFVKTAHETSPIISLICMLTEIDMNWRLISLHKLPIYTFWF